MLLGDNIIPFELELDIIKGLPVKSLIRFRSVSKAWKSLIDSSDFIADYSSKVEHLFVNYRDYARYCKEYVLIADDHSFPQQRVSPATPELVKTLRCSSIIGCSGGLLCIHGYFPDLYCPSIEVALFWNVSIRKVVSVVLPKYNIFLTDVGFGVCSKTNDPKMVHIRRVRDPESISSFRHLEVEIFTLSTGTWRRLYNNLPRESVRIRRSQVVIGGFIYWLAIDHNITLEDGTRYSYLIVSFDITSEEFGEVNLPLTLARQQSSSRRLHLSKLRKNLVVIECDKAERDHSFIVWMMEDGNSKSFTRLYSIYTSDASIRGVLEFRKTGEPLLAIYERDSCYRDNYDASLVVYEPYSKRIANHVIDGKKLLFSVFSYTETLLLHDHPNFVIYDKGKCFTLKQRAAESRRFSMHTNEKLNLWDRR